MSFANPAGLWLLTLAIPVLLLHVLRPQRDPVDVSSVFLWRALAVPVSAARPWQRLRPSLLLLAQLLAVVGLALAVARPVQVTDAPVAEHTVFIVDASGSMAAKDGDPDRLAAAIAEAKRLRGELPDGGMASVVVADTRPRVALTASPDRGAFDDALDAVETTPGAADFAGAFALAESLETTGSEIGFVLVSDGGLTDAEQRLIPPGTAYRAVGDRATNRAITRLTVEPKGGGLYAIVALRNTGGSDATQTLRLDVDGRTQYTDEISLGAGEAREVGVDLPAGDRVEAFLEGEDLLDADDHVYATAPRRQAIDVTVAVPEEAVEGGQGGDATGADRVLDALLQAIPGANVTWVVGSQPAPDADLVIYDQVDVPDDPGAPFWAIAPPGGVPGVTVTGTAAEPVPTLVRSDDPLLEGVDLTEVSFADTQQLDAPAAETLVGAEGTPLMLRGRVGELPFVYMGFPLLHSTLPVHEAFPILGDRILGELAGATLPAASTPIGAALPVDAARDNVVTGPGGTRIEVPAGAPAPHADRVGFWTVETEGQPERTLAVNPAPGESDLAPAASVLAPERTRRPGDDLPHGQSSVLAWVVLPLLLVLAAEWWLARRRSGVSRRQFRVATALRLLVALALVGALLDLAWIRPADRVATMFVVDASDSLGAGGGDEALSWVRQAIDGMPGDARAGVALFGGDARLELTMQSDPDLSAATVQIDPSRTNLAGALRLAAAVLPSDARRRIVLVSDGRPTEGDVEEEAQRLAAAGIPVDIHLVEREGGPDVAVSGVDVPSRARQGERIPVTARIVADRPGDAVVTLLANGEEVDERTVTLQTGANEVGFSVPANRTGLVRYQVRVATATDTVRENDVGYGAVQVDGPPRVLLLQGTEDAGAGVAGALRAGGITVDAMEASALPPLDELSTYSSILLADVPADAFTGDQVRTLSAAVRDLGRGLVTLGGTHSYGLGGYLDSELEQLLPVISDILDPQRRQTVSEVLAIDTSESMGACHCADGGNGMPSGGNRVGGGVNKTDISRAGAARAIEALSESDEVGILAVDTHERWVLDLQQLPAEDVVSSGLRDIQPTGSGTDLSRALSTAAEALRQSHTSLKHIILFTDGFVSDEGIFDDMAAEAAALREEGITVSVLATGEGAADDLAAIAEAGGGRFYPGRDLQEIPQIMQEEAVIASRDFVNEGEFVPVVTSSAATVRDLEATPPLLGYIATTAKPQTDTQLRIGPDQDPLLVSWNVGLGRATSWTSDSGERWSQTWTDWAGYVDFWSAVVSDTFPRDRGQAVTAEINDGKLSVRLEGDEAFPEGSEATARVTGPDLETQDVRLERVGSDTFAGELPVTAAGSYAVGATVSGGEGADGSAGAAVGGTALANLSYGAEYSPSEADPALLRRLSAQTSGRGEISADQAFDSDGLRAGRSRLPLARWLLLAAALAWPVAVALSRLALRGAVANRARYAGATAVWWLRTGWLQQLRRRLPTLPSRARRSGGSDDDASGDAETAAPDDSSRRARRRPGAAPPDGGGSRPRPERPQPPPSRRTDDDEPKEPAVAASLGSLLESKRRRTAQPPDASDRGDQA